MPHVEKGEETKEDDGAGGRMLFYVLLWCMRSCVLHDSGSTSMWNRKTVVGSGVVGQIARSGFAGLGFGWGLFSVCWCLFAQCYSSRTLLRVCNQ